MSIVDVALGLYSQDRQRSEARKNRSFQREMSNTAYQRAAADMEAAGLNRILALGSPATTPGGSVAQISNIGGLFAAGQSQMEQAAAATSQAETSAKGQQATERQINKTIEKMESEIGNIDARTEQSIQQTRTIRTIANLVERFSGEGLSMLDIIKAGANEIGEAIAADIGDTATASNFLKLAELLSKIPGFEYTPAGMIIKELKGDTIELGSGGPQ